MKIEVSKPITKSIYTLLTGCFLLSLAFSCKDDNDDIDTTGRALLLVANSTVQWTGIAISQNQRLFTNYPNWKPEHTLSVVEVTDTTNVKAYPNAEWNTWSSELNPAEHFICVQSVFVDKQNFLWVLDPANPQRMGEYIGVVPGGAKLIKIDLNTNSVVQKILFDEPAIEKTSYLNDIRIDEDKQIGYITDSNAGALVVVDLKTGAARRYLASDPTTKSENRILKVEGVEVRNEKGKYLNSHSDGIALNPDRTFLYWRPLNGESLYRLPTSLLNDPNVSDSSLSANVDKMGNFPPSDGMIFGKDGRLYLTSLEENAIRVYQEGGKSTSVFSRSDYLKWPDSFAVGPDGAIYVTTSQIHIKNPTEPYRIFKLEAN
jgi:sugar lactone lactonase YvrE